MIASCLSFLHDLLTNSGICFVIKSPSKRQKLVFGVSFPAFVLSSQSAGLIRHTVQVVCQAFLR